MRKLSLALLAALALPLFTACGDDSSGSDSSLNAQDKQQLAGIAQSLAGYDGMISSYSDMAKSMASGFAEGFTTAGRKTASSCGAFDTTMTEAGMTIKLKISKLDGSSFASCDEAAALLGSTGAKMTMTMSSSQQGMNLNANLAMTFRINPTTGGISMVMDMTMNMSGSEQGQSFSMSINPLHLAIDQASSTSTPVIAGYMTMSFNDLTISQVKMNNDGIVPGTYDVLKSGTKVATIVVTADGTATAYDLSGNQIKG